MQSQVPFSRVNFELVHPLEEYGTVAVVQVSILKGADWETTGVIRVVGSGVRLVLWSFITLLAVVDLVSLRASSTILVIAFMEMVHDGSLVLQRWAPGMVFFNDVQVFHPKGVGLWSGFISYLPVITPVHTFRIIDSLAESKVWVEFF